MENSEDKTIRSTPTEDVKKLILQKEGNGAENDYSATTQNRGTGNKDKGSASEINSNHITLDAMQGTNKVSDNPESKDSDQPYEDTLMPEAHSDQPLSEVVKSNNNEK